MSVGDDWWDLPRPAQGIKLYEIREELREKNLHDTEEPPLETATAPPAGAVPNVRTSDGTYNDVSCPRMGSAGIRFGRNVPLSEAFPDTANLMNPSPRRVSLELLTRDDVPAGDDPQRHRRGLDSVHGARLVRAQEGHVEPHPRHPGRRRRRLARAADAGAEDAGGCRPRSPTRRGRRPTSTRTRTGGTARTSTAAVPRRRRRFAPAAKARCWSARAAGSASIRSPAGRSPASPRTAGSA